MNCNFNYPIDTERLVTWAEARPAVRTPAYSSLLNIYDWRDQSDAFLSAASRTSPLC